MSRFDHLPVERQAKYAALMARNHTSLPAVTGVDDGSCIHLGRSAGHVAACRNCSGRDTVEAFHCTLLGGLCTRSLKAADSSLRRCSGCQSRDSQIVAGRLTEENSIAHDSIIDGSQFDRSSLTAPCRDGRPFPWLGSVTRKTWEYPVQLVVAHLDTPDHLAEWLTAWQSQTVTPFVTIVDTGSSGENLTKLLQFESPSVEVIVIRGRSYRHPSEPVSQALDTAFAACRCEYQLHTHTDVFPRRRNLIADLLNRCRASNPVVGYEQSERDHVGGFQAANWRGNVGHVLTMLHVPTIRSAGVVWSMEHAAAEFGIPTSPPSATDTEYGFNAGLKAAGIVPDLLGRETNYERQTNDDFDHCRSHTGTALYDAHRHKQADGWLTDATADSQQRDASERSPWALFSYADLIEIVHRMAESLPSLSAVVGVPRSGIIPASILSLRRNIPLLSFDALLSDVDTYRKPESRPIDAPDGPILLLDDTTFSGHSMRRYRELLADRSDVLYAAVWAGPDGRPTVDHYAAEVDDVFHAFEWNVGRDTHSERTMFDMDGILCEEPPVIDWLPDRPNPEYENWLAVAKPLLRPSFALHSICTGRLERYRSITEHWLNEQGIEYGKLIMHPATDWKDREHEGHAQYKARHYAESDATLFLESNADQAEAIHKRTAKTTVTLSPFQVFQ